MRPWYLVYVSLTFTPSVQYIGVPTLFTDTCTLKTVIHAVSHKHQFFPQSGVKGQADVEAGAQAEIREILEQQEELEKKRAESAAAREQLIKERDSVGVMWGMGERG